MKGDVDWSADTYSYFAGLIREIKGETFTGLWNETSRDLIQELLARGSVIGAARHRDHGGGLPREERREPRERPRPDSRRRLAAVHGVARHQCTRGRRADGRVSHRALG